MKTRTEIRLLDFTVKGLDSCGEKSPPRPIQEHGYAKKYRKDGKPIRKISTVFGPETRILECWEAG